MVRYGERHTCEKCDRDAKFYRAKERRSYACEHCGHQVYPMAGTPFERTRTSLQDWFYVMHLFCSSRNGVSAKEVERQIGCTYKTAWRMCRLIREYMTDVDGDAPLGGPGKRPVEADKAYIGGYRKGGHGGKGKEVVLGMVERGGEVMTWVVPSKSRKHVRPVIQQSVVNGARIMTDEGKAFLHLDDFGYTHETVNHAQGEYVRGDAHTNTIEGFWSLFKAAYHGTYVHVSPKWLPLYLGEFEFRWNLRHAPEAMLETLLQGFLRPAHLAA